MFDLLKSDEPFPVDFDDAWQWLGYTRKDSAKDQLTRNFVKGTDWVFRSQPENSQNRSSAGGRPSEKIKLTIDCFKSFSVMAETEKGREVRLYFLECEKKYKELRDRQQSTQLAAQQHLALMEQGINLLERLGQLCDRDKLVYGDAIRNLTLNSSTQTSDP